MDFDWITANVSQYVDKQKSSMLENPRNINMALRKLNLYVDSFHNDIHERFESENRTVPVEVAVSVKRPVIEFDPDRLESADKIKSLLVSLSNQLVIELNRSRRQLESFLRFTQEDLNDFRYNMRSIINEFEKFPHQNTYLGNILNAIKYDLAIPWDYEKTIKRLHRSFEEIKSIKVIEELRKNTVNQQQITDDIIDQYNTYFNTCLWKYKTYYSGSEQLALSEETEKLIEPMRTMSNMDQFLAENERGLIEQRNKQMDNITLAVQEAPSAQESPISIEVTSVMIIYKDKEPKTIEMSVLSEPLRTELAEVLMKISSMSGQ